MYRIFEDGTGYTEEKQTVPASISNDYVEPNLPSNCEQRTESEESAIVAGLAVQPGVWCRQTSVSPELPCCLYCCLCRPAGDAGDNLKSHSSDRDVQIETDL